MANEKRERALRLIVDLRKRAEHANTAPAEAEVCRAKIKELQARYSITAEAPKAKPKPKQQAQSDWFNRTHAQYNQQQQYKRPGESDEQFFWRVAEEAKRQQHGDTTAQQRYEEDLRRRQAARDKAWRDQNAKWNADHAAEQERKRKRAEWDKAEAARRKAEQERAAKNRDAWEQLKDAADASAEAARKLYERADPYDRGYEPLVKVRGGDCYANKWEQSFYAGGGKPRRRNKFQQSCEKCGTTLRPGEGSLDNIHGKWVVRCARVRPNR